MASGDWKETAFLAGAVLIFLTFDVTLVLFAMGWFKPKNHFPVDGRTVLVTGASQGMGRAAVKLLAQKGANVVIVSRNASKMEAVVEEMKRTAMKPQIQRFHYISADLAKNEESIRVVEEVTQWNNGEPPDIVWTIAGAAHPSLFIDVDAEVLREQMDTNYWTAAYLGHAILRSWLKPFSKLSESERKAAGNAPIPRQFIMTSSVAAFAGLAGYAPYAPTKAAMRCLADCLRSELNLYNGARRGTNSSVVATAPVADVKIRCVFPGCILSPGFENESRLKHPITKILEDADIQQTEEEAAKASIKELEGGAYFATTQIIGSAMRAGSLQGSPRNSLIVDTLFGWLANLLWLFIAPDMERKAWKYGKTHGVTKGEPGK